MYITINETPQIVETPDIKDAPEIGILRETFQTKKWGNFEKGPNREGGVVKKSKKSQVSAGKNSKLGGCPRNSKKSQVPEGTKD